MKFGVVYPQTQLGADPIVMRDFLQAAEDMGYHHLLVYDHVLGANPAREGWQSGRPYTYRDSFNEPFTLFAWMAALTKRIGFMTGVLILPQRQTALVAKQAAQVDLLSGGRFRMGIGVGWNEVEYTSLGMDFRTRGARSEEQIELMRMLWTRDLVSYRGRFDTIDEAGINPLPQRPVPIWIGGTADVVLERAARMSDGWVAQSGDPQLYREHTARFWAYAEAAGSADRVGLHTRLSTQQVPENDWESYVAGWAELGATELAVYPHGEELDDYLGRLRRFQELFDL
ncbi:MAG: LLM class F420-dependent oxidoreductase [Chloroflexota bacterium]|nr:LLM class F420-dependent oxidoreductase [Chloroflexota bacterium]